MQISEGAEQTFGVFDDSRYGQILFVGEVGLDDFVEGVRDVLHHQVQKNSLNMAACTLCYSL